MNGADWIREEHLPRVATHEAGHAIVDLRLGYRISGVLLEVIDEESGLWGGRVGIEPDPDADGLCGLDDRKVATSKAAGLVAEAIRRGEPLAGLLEALPDLLDPDETEGVTAGDDEADLARLAAEGVDVKACVREAWRLLEADWPAVEAVAGAVLAKWTPGETYLYLDPREVNDLIERGTK